MGAAEVISFEEVRARKQWDTLRQQLHARFDLHMGVVKAPVCNFKQRRGRLRVYRQMCSATDSRRVDLLEHENAFVLVADLPGMHQEDINVSVQDNVLTLEGKRTFEHVENGQGKYQYSERASGTCCRRFLLSTAVKAAQITATYKQGVLEVHLPKAVEAQPKRIAVQAST